MAALDGGMRSVATRRERLSPATFEENGTGQNNRSLRNCEREQPRTPEGGGRGARHQAAATACAPSARGLETLASLKISVFQKP